MLKSHIKTAVFCYCCLILMLVLARPISAQSGLGPGVDLIVLIDQSNSMFGLGATEDREALPGTDRDGRRVDTAQYLIDYMAFDNSYVNKTRANRVLVIAFGSYGEEEVIVPLTELTTENNVRRAKDLVEPLRSPTESLNGTDFISAFERVSESFSSSDEDLVTSELRRRLIVVITDGGPDIRGTEFDSRSEYFEHLKDVYQAKLGESYPTYVIGIDKNEPPIYWTDVVELWENSVTGKGDAIRVTDPDEINKQVVKMLCPFLNPTGTGDECRLQDIGNHFILPYARYVSFSFFKYDPSAEIELYRPTLSGSTGGDRVQIEPARDLDVVEYNETKSDEFFGLENPRPGCWRSEREGAGKVDVLLQIVFNDMMMTKPSSAHPLISPLDFEFSLKDTKGEPIDELGDFPISLRAELIAPDGTPQTVTMIKEKPGLYSSQKSAFTSMTGTHRLNLVGTTVVPALDDCLSAPETFTVFSQTFQVPVYQPSIIVDNPNGAFSPYAPLEQLTMEIVDKNRESIQVNPRLAPELRIAYPDSEDRLIEDISIVGHTLRVDRPLTFPRVGVYTLTASLKDPEGDLVFKDVTQMETSKPVRVIHPSKEYPAFAPLRFVEIELQDEKGQPVATNPTYPLHVEASMIWPDGNSETVALTPTTEKGHYRVAASWPLTQVATHQLKVSGYTPLLAGADPEQVFITRETISVSGNLPYFQVNKPTESQDNQTYSLHHWFLPPLPFEFTQKPQPIEVELRFANRPAKVDEFFIGDFDDLFHVDIFSSDGEVLVEDLALSSDGVSHFSAEIPQLNEPGIFKAVISLDGQLLGNTDVQDIWPNVNISFQRRDSVVYIVSWIAIGTVAFGAVAYFGGGWIMNRFVLPKAKGKLVARPSGIQKTSSSLWDWDVTREHKNHFIIQEGDIDARLRLSRIKVRRATPMNRGKKPEEGIEVVAYSEEGVIVAQGPVYPSRSKLRVRVKTSDKKPYKLEYEA